MKKEMRKMRGLGAIALILVLVVGIVAVSVLRSPSSDSVAVDPEPNSTPVDPKPSELTDPKPTEPNSTAPIAPSPIVFSEKAKVMTEYRPNGAIIYCEIPVGAKVTLGVDAEFTDYNTDIDEDGDRWGVEPCFLIRSKGYDLILFGVDLTDNLKNRLTEKSVVDLKGRVDVFVQVSAGEKIGTVNKKKVTEITDGENRIAANLVITIAFAPDCGDLIEPTIAAILESIRR